MEGERGGYTAGAEGEYVYPGDCDMAKLTNLTASPPESDVTFGETLLASGILAQMLLKAVVGSWLLYVFSMFEPMTLHRGMIELYHVEKDFKGLPKEEDRDLRRFARDKKIFGLVFWSLFLSLEILILVYSAAAPRKRPEFPVLTLGVNGSSSNVINFNASMEASVGNWTCDRGLLKPKI
jgi:hypothetical protein